MRSTPRSSASCVVSTIVTGKPPLRKARPMPVPMVPAPRMPTVLMSRSLVSGPMPGRLAAWRSAKNAYCRARAKGLAAASRNTARSRAWPSSMGSVVAASTASMAALGATGPLGWRPSEARAFSNSPAGNEALSIFFSPMRRGGLPTCRLAKATAAATTSPSASLSIRPAAAPFCASMNVPVMMSCRACSTPMARGRRCVPPAPGMMPSLISGRPSWRTSLVGDAVVAAQRQLEPAAQRGAVDGRDDRLGGRLDAVDELRQVGLLHLGAELGDVGAGREEAARTGEHDGLHARIGVGLVEGLLQPDPQGMAQRVDRRVVHADDSDVALLLRLDYGHDGCSSFPGICRHLA